MLAILGPRNLGFLSWNAARCCEYASISLQFRGGGVGCYYRSNFMWVNLPHLFRPNSLQVSDGLSTFLDMLQIFFSQNLLNCERAAVGGPEETLNHWRCFTNDLQNPWFLAYEMSVHILLCLREQNKHICSSYAVGAFICDVHVKNSLRL